MSKRLPSLNALRTFESVVRLGSMSAAADELFVSPGAVSRQIKNLQEDLGSVLLERSGRGVRPTVVGEHLARGLEVSFAHLAKTVEQTRQRSLRGKVRILISPFFAANWLIPRLDNFHRLAPKTDIIVYEKSARTTVAACEADLSIEWGRFANSAHIVAEKIVDDEIIPVCIPQICSNGSLAGIPLLRYEDLPDSWNWPDWPTFLSNVGLDGIETTEGPSFTRGLMRSAVFQGKGAMLTNTSIVHDLLAAKRLVRPVAGSMATDNSYWLLTPRTNLDRPEIRNFRAWLLDEAAACFGEPAHLPHEASADRMMDGVSGIPPPPPPHTHTYHPV